jgi:hypothetical protein
MNDYILKLKFTKIEPPPNTRPESKDFPRAKVRTTTPKFKNLSFDNNSNSRLSTPRIARLKQRPRTVKKPSNSPKSINIKLNVINFEKNPASTKSNFQANSWYNPVYKNDNLSSKAFYSKYRVRNPSRILILPSTSFKLD